MLERLRHLLGSRNEDKAPDTPAEAAPKDGAPSVLNVGGGSKAIAIPSLYEGWNHVLLDIKARPDVDLVCDARRLGDQPPGRFDAVYCSHNLEHYYHHEVPQVLQGFRHVLADGGFCDIRVPDLQAVFERALAMSEDIEAALYDSEAGPVSVLDVIYGFGPQLKQSGEPYYAHNTGFTALTLERALRQAGFPEAIVLRHPPYELRAIALKNVAPGRSAKAAHAVDALYAFGSEAWRSDAPETAASAARAAIAIDPSLPALHYLLGCAELDADCCNEAQGAFADCLSLAPPYPLSLQATLHAALARARVDLACGARPRTADLPAARPALISVVICSARPVRFARAREAYELALDGLAHEIVGIHDAHSLAEGYNRGLAASRGEIVLFSHDDVRTAAPDFAARLLRRLENADLVGVAGTTHAVTSSWLGADTAHLAGQIALPGEGGRMTVTAYGGGVIASGAQALDGVLLACRRELAASIGFDAGAFDGWHGYDFDFSFRAHLAGHRLAVAGDLLIVHDSTGGFDTPDWRRYAGRALEKHRGELPAGAALPQQPQLCSVEVRSAEEWRLMTGHMLDA